MIEASYDINFPEKDESSYFLNLEKECHKGGHGRANFSLKLLVKMKKIDFELGFQTKIGFPQAPLLAPLLQIRKVWTLSFLWKKINVVNCLDQFLAICKMRWKKMDFQFYQNGRQKIAIFCPSARFSKNFFLHNFTVSYIILDLLESYCKLQDMYSALKWHQDVLFWVPETPETLYNLSSEERNSSMPKCSWSSLQKLWCTLLRNISHLLISLYAKMFIIFITKIIMYY